MPAVIYTWKHLFSFPSAHPNPLMHLGMTSLVSRGVLALPLLGHMEAEVLQQDDGARGGVGAGGLHFSTNTVLQEGDVPAEVQSACGDKAAAV